MTFWNYVQGKRPPLFKKRKPTWGKYAAWTSLYVATRPLVFGAKATQSLYYTLTPEQPPNRRHDDTNALINALNHQPLSNGSEGLTRIGVEELTTL